MLRFVMVEVEEEVVVVGAAMANKPPSVFVRHAALCPPLKGLLEIS